MLFASKLTNQKLLFTHHLGIMEDLLASLKVLSCEQVSVISVFNNKE